MTATQAQQAELTAFLGQFTGTTQYYRSNRFIKRFFHTDGVQALAEKAQAFWLIDAICSHQSKALRHQKDGHLLHEFQLWKLIVNPDRTARLECYPDSDVEKPSIRQNIPFTDFPLSKIKLYVESGADPESGRYYCLLLPSEH
ncbi:MAG: hypothetical protein KME10_22175 [Plectolyngbya sp. WJT66-NPBG17]|jgi:hypothetical protein|nr:hypothetical protein [Plectolyngbya sp. WJT66-NPBG17]